jgi:hypothetical protein
LKDLGWQIICPASFASSPNGSFLKFSHSGEKSDKIPCHDRVSGQL